MKRSDMNSVTIRSALDSIVVVGIFAFLSAKSYHSNS
jgi:hypothetical protein